MTGGDKNNVAMSTRRKTMVNTIKMITTLKPEPVETLNNMKN